MSTTPVVNPEPSAVPAAKTKADKKSASTTPTNKYAEARLAKKKQRRKAHRLTIKRSNTNG
jgi:ribosome assembly protein YihI (activator of Der GTPase)